MESGLGIHGGFSVYLNRGGFAVDEECLVMVLLVEGAGMGIMSFGLCEI